MSRQWHLMPTLVIVLLLLLLLMLTLPGCALNQFTPPPVSLALVANARRDRADSQTLSHGRSLFVSRCLECHTLPAVAKHSPDNWPHLVSRMADRANLNASEQGAVTAYLRAASVTMAAPRRE
jgi:mono/diheme cytochrome c family protein